LDSGGADYTVIQSSCAPPRQDRAIPKILIKGYCSLNADIGRTEDDIQPYIIFDQQKIARSGAANVGDFFKTERITITGAATSDQPGETLTTDVSAINLRGLEATQTFLLVDGRRPPGGSIDGDAPQPDIIGIPLSSIESIEVLPTTGSAIYGSGTRGDAVSGVPT
jgi:iron complex outermembrane recepter protein